MYKGPLRIIGTKELENAIAVASTPEAADYLAKEFEAYLVKRKQQAELADTLLTVQEFAENVEREKGNKVNYWLGNITKLPTDFENLNRNLGIDAAKALVKETEAAIMRMDLAIDDAANFLRGYVVDGKPADTKKTALLDQLFNAWLAQKNIISKGSTLYEVNPQGKILNNEQGQPKRIQEEKFKALLVDKDEGFSHFCEKMGVKFSTHQHQYPTQAPVVDTAQQIETPTPSVVKGPEILPEINVPIGPSSGA